MSSGSSEIGAGRRWTRAPRVARTWVAAQPVRRGGMVLTPLVLAVSGLFGGLDAEPVEPPTRTVALDVPVETGPLRVTVTGARLTSAELGPIRAAPPADRWVVIVATVVVTAPESVITFSKTLALDGVSGLTEPDPRVLLVDDATQDPELHPGLPAKLGFAWPQRADAPIPRTVSVRLMGREYRRMTVSPQMAWLDLEDPVARILDVPVVDRRDAR